MAPRNNNTTHGGRRKGAGRKAGADGERDSFLSVRLTAGDRKALDAWATANGLTTSAAVVRILARTTRRAAAK